MLPLDIHHEDTLRGHLMMTLLSTAVLKILQDRLLKTKLFVSEVFSVLSRQVALVYPDSLVTSEPVKKMNDIYSLHPYQYEFLIKRTKFSIFLISFDLKTLTLRSLNL